MYISGLALLTILISFRVILAHGQTDINYELTGKLIPAVAYSLIGAALFRFFINGNFGGVQIWLAVTLFVAGAIAWLVKFLHISFSSPKA